MKEGKVTTGGGNSEHSWGGGLTFKEKTVVGEVKEKILGS
jgi:formamidase